MKRSYYRLLLPALLFIATGMLVRATDMFDPGQWQAARLSAPWLFILALVFAAAAPVFFRSLFAHRMRHEKSVPEEEFLRFQRRLIRAALFTPYLAMAAFLLEIPRFYQVGIVLATMYALYYTYPSERRIAFDRRIFRVR